MSEPNSPRLKVSREGIVLIKSFEGFRPRAIQREDGGWVIGYGHTLSAREGATVSEADAELLLRFDLLPVEAAVNGTSAPLNQHQFDALVSFAHSVGLDRFGGSDVVENLAGGATGAAADALMGWPERQRPETALRRRAAERALFVADPSTAVTLSDLLAAPLPLSPVAIEPDGAEPDAASDPSPIPSAEAASAGAPIDPRGAAVAVLLGEPDNVEDQAEPATIIPVWATETVSKATPAPVAPDGEGRPEEVAAETEVTEPEIADPEPDEAQTSEATLPIADDEARVAEDIAVASAPPISAFDRLTLTRYSPYGAAIVGPLPYLAPAAPRELPPVEEDAVSEAAAATVEPPNPADPTGATQPALDPVAETPPAAVAQTGPAPVAELILTSPEDAPEPAVARPLWEPAARDAEPRSEEGVLFGEDLGLTQGTGALMRSDHERDAPVRFDWSETGAFIIMGGVGLTAFGASMAAFRLAAEQSGGDEVTLIAWVLAVIGAACVGVSSFNLYRRFGLPGGD